MSHAHALHLPAELPFQGPLLPRPVASCGQGALAAYSGFVTCAFFTCMQVGYSVGVWMALPHQQHHSLPGISLGLYYSAMFLTSIPCSLKHVPRAAHCNTASLRPGPSFSASFPHCPHWFGSSARFPSCQFPPTSLWTSTLGRWVFHLPSLRPLHPAIPSLIRNAYCSRVPVH